MPTVSEYVLLSAQAYYYYRDNPIRQQGSGSGAAGTGQQPLTTTQAGMDTWTVDSHSYSDLDTGFSATVFRKGSEYVVAFRGTDDWDASAGDLSQNGFFGLPGLGAQTQQGIDLVNQLIADDVPLSSISFTGHSLGGGLAGIMAGYFNRPATVFDPAPYFQELIDLAQWSSEKIAQYNQNTANNVDVIRVQGEVLDYIFGENVGSYKSYETIDLGDSDHQDSGVSLPLTLATLGGMIGLNVGGAIAYDVLFGDPRKLHHISTIVLAVLGKYATNDSVSDVFQALQADPSLLRRLLDEDLTAIKSYEQDAEDKSAIEPSHGNFERVLVLNQAFATDFAQSFRKLDDDDAGIDGAPGGANNVENSLLGHWGELRNTIIDLGFIMARKVADRMIGTTPRNVGDDIRFSKEITLVDSLFGNIDPHSIALSFEALTTTNGNDSSGQIDRLASQLALLDSQLSGIFGPLAYPELFERLDVAEVSGTDATLVIGSIAGDGANYTLQSGFGIFLGGDFGDAFVGAEDKDFFYGGDGNDELRGQGGDDYIDGAGDDDLIEGGAGNDKLYGSSGSDRLTPGVGTDQAYGGYGDDLLVAEIGDGDDSLDGGLSLAPSLWHLDGTDTIIYKYYHGNAAIVLDDASEIFGTTMADFGLSISADARGRDGEAGGFGSDTLSSIERASVEAGDGADLFLISEQSQGSYINYVDLGSQAAGSYDTVNLSLLTMNARIDLEGGKLAWQSPGIVFGSLWPYSYTIGLRNAEEAFGGSGDDFLQSRNEAGTSFHLSGGDGNDKIIGLGGDDILEGGDGNDTISSFGGTNTIIDNAGENLIVSRGDHDTVEIEGSDSHIELGSKTVVVGADANDSVSRYGITLHGGVQQWWNESGTAVWSPYGSLINAYPFIGAQAFFAIAAIAADAPYMKFAKYRVEADTGDLLIDLGWGLGGSARIIDYDVDLNSGIGDAGLTVFRQGNVKQGANSAIKASNGVEQYVNLALYAGWGYGLEGYDPLVLDLDDNGYDLISREYSQVYFEFDSDGFAENTGWIGGNDAFLVRDANSNGQIDNVTEMFGNRTTSGFTALAALDSNSDGVFDSTDADFGAVRLWRDVNSDGITDAGELITLADAGIASISLTPTTLTDTDVRGNVIAREGSFTRTDGTTGKVGDVALDVSDIDTRWTSSQTPSQAAEALPQIAGIGELVNLRLAMTGDATLLSMINGFASNSTASISALRGEVADILYRWAGVDGVAATALGSNGFDERKLAFLEKYVGIALVPRDSSGAILTTNLAEVEALWNHEFNQLAFKLIAQGPLAAEFAGFSYYESQDMLRAANADTVATILAGFLDDMPTDAIAAEAYWTDWGPLLGAFAGSVMRTSGIDVGRDYFFAELVKAVDSRALPLDVEALAAGLAIDGVRIGGVSPLDRGSDSGTLVYYSESGNQSFTGGTGQDAYIFGRTIGDAVIDDNEARENGDRIRFAFLDPGDVTMERDGNDLLITVIATGESVRVLGQFAPVTVLGADYLLSSNKGVEDIQFADGTIYEASDIAIATGKGTSGDDQLAGSMHSDVLQGLAGNDILMGGDDADIYVINGGEGQDVIREVQTTPMLRAADLLIFGENVSPDDIEFVREGEGYDDLRIKVGTEGDSVLIEGQFGYSVLGYNGGLALNSRIEGFSFRHYGAAWSSKEIENLLIERATSDGDDVARGFGNNDYFIASAGNDLLVGMDGGDVYEFGVGSGNDTIDEQARYIDATVGLGGLAIGEGNDVVRFNGLTLADISFTRLSSAPDLTITIGTTGETLTVKGQFDGFQTGYFDAQWMDRIERFEFADGNVLNWQQVLALVTTGTDGDDHLWGDLYEDRFVGGLGNDTLSGGGKADEYVFNLGDGQDIIRDNNQFLLGAGILTVDNAPDYVTLGAGITPEMITLSRSGADFTLTIGTNGDSVTLQGQDDLINTGIFGVWGPDRIEEIRFDNGTTWTWQDLNIRWIADHTTSGDDVVTGFTLEDVLEASAGNDILAGGDSGDVYRFGLGAGQDIVRESVDNAMYDDNDSVEFGAGIAPEDIQLSRTGDDLIVTLLDGSSLTIEDQFVFDAQYTWHDIETFVFANGVTWASADVRAHFLTATSGDDVITGFNNDDILDGGAGNDILRGGNGSDIYHYDIGYGNDVIEESVTNTNLADADRVVFGPALLATDVSVARSNDDLVLTVISTGETLTVKDHFSFSNWFSWKDVERFEFADGTIWTDLDIARDVTGGTPSDDVINGTFRSDTLDGGLGNDILAGGDGADIYVFGLGYGADEIRETVSDANLSENDELRFGPGVVESDLSFARDGLDLVVSINGTNDSVRVVKQWDFASWYTWNDIERFSFDDGSFLSKEDVQVKLLASTSGADNLSGFMTGDRMDGATGDDILQGRDGADTYVFGIGYGHDQVVETVTDANLSDNDSVEFGPGIGWDDLTFSRSGDDLTISLVSGDTLFIGGQFGTATDTTTYTWRDIENFRFADGTVKTKADLFAAMIEPTDGDDILTGYYTSDSMSGELGNDTLSGGRGNDTYIYGAGDGDDIIIDSNGQNVLQLEAGIAPADIYFSTSPGNPDNMVLRFSGSAGSVTLAGQVSSSAGVNNILFADGTNWNRATILAEYLARQGTDGSDFIGGDDTPNVFDGGASDDDIASLGGADDLTGGAGNDRLSGGSGNDIYRYAPGDGSDVIADSGNDTGDRVVLGTGILPTDVLLDPDQGNADNMFIRFIGGTDFLLVEGQWDDKGVEYIEFADGTIWDAAEIANQFALGEVRAGNQTISGTGSADVLNGYGGNDTIYGGGGNDTLIGGTGNDYSRGDGGSDTYIFNLGDGQDRYFENEDQYGWGGTETIRFGLGISLEDLQLTKTAADWEDLLITIAGTTDSILLDEHDGSWQGRYFNRFENFVFQTEESDGSITETTVTWSQLNETRLEQASTSGDDVIIAGTAAETVDAGAGNDTVYGWSGNDILAGGAGNDYIRGDSGNDTYVFNLGDGQDKYFENEDQYGWGGTETIRFGLGITLEDLQLTKTTADWEDLLITITGTTDSILLDEHDGSWQGRYFNRFENFVFQTEESDGSITETTVTWSQLNDIRLEQASTSGDDVIIAGTAAETVDAGAGNDTVYGWSGNDILAGGAGNDYIRGDSGNDTYVFNLGDGQDKYFENEDQYGWGGTETIRFGLGISLEDLQLTKTTADWEDLLITIAGTTDSILLDEHDGSWQGRYFNRFENFVFQTEASDGSIAETTVSWSQLDAYRLGQAKTNGNDTIIGGVGADTIEGGEGDDTLHGWSGNDLLIGGEGNDVLSAGAGADIAVLAGMSGDYSMAASGGTLNLTDNAPTIDGDDGTDSLISVETLRFGDGEEVGVSSPIILDLDGGGVATLSAIASISRYDMDGDGVGDNTSWMGAGEGMLFLDRDGNGTLTNAGEFSFVNDVADAPSDLAGLRAFDSDGNGRLAAGDVRFADFRIWRDGNGNGVVDTGEILSLGDAGVQSLDLAGIAVEGASALGDVAVVNTGSYTRTDGTQMGFIDAALTYFSGGAAQQSNALLSRWYDLGGGRDWISFGGFRPNFHSAAQFPTVFEGPMGDIRRAILTSNTNNGWESFPERWAKIDVHERWWDGSVRFTDIIRPDGPAPAPQAEGMTSSNADFAPIDRRLAAMVQDMASFGAQSAGEGLSGMPQEYTRPVDLFA